jgi:hypothetical protein
MAPGPFLSFFLNFYASFRLPLGPFFSFGSISKRSCPQGPEPAGADRGEEKTKSFFFFRLNRANLFKELHTTTIAMRHRLGIDTEGRNKKKSN